MAAERATAIVTGGNRGIGFEVCRQLGRLGYRVILAARDEGRGREAAGRLREDGLEVEPFAYDVTSDASAEALGRFARESLGRVDALINNAAVSLDDTTDSPSILDAPDDVLRRTLETNLHGPLRTTRAIAPAMTARGSGRIVNVSSQLGSLAGMGGGYATYRISKAALNALTRILAAELLETGVLVNSACPGWVRTEMGGPNAPRSPEQGAETIVWLATLPDDGPTGGFFQDFKPIPW